MQGPEDPGGHSKRKLAAIVFTDIVSFSARVQEDEERTLALAERDLGEIRLTCEANGGRVLKGTGDGLLLYFDSAVEAVACSLSVQRYMAERAETLPAEQCLEHRIGIHLGDVFLRDDDVMGDGVNIASRLQSEAPPGGICISQTVYDVVKNRLQLRATPLGPRELKNIRESIPVYQILMEAVGEEGRPAARRRLPAIGWKGPVAVGAVALLIAVIAAAWWLGRSGGQGSSGEPVVAATSRPAEPSLPSSPTPGAQSPAPPTLRGMTPTRAPGLDSRPEEELNEARREYLPPKDILGMLAWIEDNGLGQAQLATEYRRLGHLANHARSRMTGQRAGNPVLLTSPGGSSSLIWTEEGMLVVQEGDNTSVVPWEGLSMHHYISLLTTVASTPEQKRAAQFLAKECRRAGLLEQP